MFPGVPDASFVPVKQLMPAKGRVEGSVGLWSASCAPTTDLHLHIPSCSYFHYKWI